MFDLPNSISHQGTSLLLQVSATLQTFSFRTGCGNVCPPDFSRWHVDSSGNPGTENLLRSSKQKLTQESKPTGSRSSHWRILFRVLTLTWSGVLSLTLSVVLIRTSSYKKDSLLGSLAHVTITPVFEGQKKTTCRRCVGQIMRWASGNRRW